MLYECPCHLRTVIWLGDMDSPEGWWTAIRSVPHELPTTDLRNPLVPFCHARLSHYQTGEEGLAIRIWRRLSIFGHVWRLPEATPAHCALRLAVDTRAGGKPDIRPEWKRQRGRPCRTWVQQIEDDTGLNANDAWRIAHDRKSWRALRPVAGQAFHWLTNWFECTLCLKSRNQTATINMT